jgi:hypothetical protein
LLVPCDAECFLLNHSQHPWLPPRK